MNTNNNSLSRRNFIKTTGAAGLTMAAAPRILAEDKSGRPYRTALIGSGWWGNNILSEAMQSGQCRVVGLCDVDSRMLDSTLKKVEEGTGDKPKTYRDYREMLEKEEIDIAIVATPDHWHPLQTIAACEAGAHVFVEKPIGHTIAEGRAMVDAARKTKRVVQVGTHRRIAPHNVSGREFIRSGKLGEIGMVHSFVRYGGGGREKPKPNIEPPKELDWDMWCGPAPMRPFNGALDLKNPWSGAIHPRGFRKYLDYANGILGDWGIHWMDQILWIMDEPYPSHVYSTGGRPILGPPVLTDKEQTSDAPDHQVATFKFEKFTATWEHRQFGGTDVQKGENYGCYFYGTKGTLHMGWRSGWTFYPSSKGQPVHNEKASLHKPDDQNIRELWADFLHCIKTGNKPVCDIEDIHHSTNMSLLGMLSWKLGRGVEWDGEKEKILKDRAANKLLKRKYRGSWKYPG